MRRPSDLLLAVFAAAVACATLASAPLVRDRMSSDLHSTAAAALPDDRPAGIGAELPELTSHHGLGMPHSTRGGRGAVPLGAGLDGLPGAALDLDGELADASMLLANAHLGTYIDELLAATDSLVTRWPVRAGTPLRYWIQPGSELRGWTITHRRMLDEAFEEWSEAGLPVRFESTTDSASANVVVLWRAQFDEPISGKTRWTHDRRGWIRDARVTIALRRSTGEPLDADAVRAIALHEVGHALGMDHTLDATNVMAPRVRVRSLSAADRATAQLLYRLPAGSLKR